MTTETERLELRYVPLPQVVRWDRNPKKHDLGAICRAIETHGFIDPPKFDPTLNNGDGGLLYGNGRSDALTAMHAQRRPLPRGIAVDDDGVWHLPIIFGVDAASQTAAEQAAVDHNNLTMAGGEYTALDMSRMWESEGYLALLTDLAEAGALPVTVDGDDLDALLAELTGEALPEPGAGGDEFDTSPVEGPTRTALGDLWLIDGGKHRVVVGDSTDPATVARLMGGERAALIVTSPPYNQNLDTFKPSGMQKENPAFVQRMASAYHDSKPENEYQDEQVALLEMLARHMTPNGSIFYNHKIRYRDKRIVSPLEWLRRLSFPVRQEIIWDRGSSITLNARMFIPADERIYWMRVGDDFVFNDTPDIKAWSTVWEVAAVNEVRDSAAFAVEIPTRCILASSLDGDIVLEPYCGTGTTLIAAHRTGRRCYGCEIEPKYADVILRRAEAEGLTVERAADA